MADQAAEPKVFDLFGEEFASPNMEAPTDLPANPNAVTEETDGEPVAGVSQAETSELIQEINLGEGGGKQVFKAKSPEEMIAKLTKAQENATRKIREQQFELQRAKKAAPEKTSTRPQPKQLTADDKFALAQEFGKDPEAALDKLLSAKGITTADLNQIVVERERNTAEMTFLQKHEGVDFLPSPGNAKAIHDFLSKENLPYTANNLEYAFQELSEGGLLDMPSSDAASSEGETTEQEPRIVVPQHTRRKPMSTGLSSKDAGARQEVKATTTTKSGLTESEVEQLYRMNEEDGRKFILKKMRELSGSR